MYTGYERLPGQYKYSPTCWKPTTVLQRKTLLKGAFFSFWAGLDAPNAALNGSACTSCLFFCRNRGENSNCREQNCNLLIWPIGCCQKPAWRAALLQAADLKAVLRYGKKGIREAEDCIDRVNGGDLTEQLKSTED